MKPYQLMRMLGEQSAPWQPSNIDAPIKVLLDDSSDVTDVSGACSAWGDRSGNSYHFTQNTASKRPLIVPNALNGHRILSLDGSNDNMTNTGTGARSIYSGTGAGWCFAVYRRRNTTAKNVPILQSRESTSAAARITCYAGVSTPADRQNKARILARRLNGDTSKQLGSGVEVGTDWTATMYSVQWTTGTGTIIVNGNIVETGNVSSSGNTSGGASDTAIYLGSEGETSFADIDIACFLLGSGTIPSAADTDRLFGYYLNRYGLADLLPSGHPYRYSPP